MGRPWYEPSGPIYRRAYVRCSEPRLFARLVDEVTLENPSWLKKKTTIKVADNDAEVGDMFEGYYDMLLFKIKLKTALLDEEQSDTLQDIVFVKKSRN